MPQDLLQSNANGTLPRHIGVSPMKKHIIAATIVTLTAIVGGSSFANAANVPCEDLLKTLTDTLAKAKLNDADMKAVAELKAKGEERCTAEDDKRADAFFTDAIKLASKK